MNKKKTKKPKFKVGDLVYNWQSPNRKSAINMVRVSSDPNYEHSYRLTIIGKDGIRRNSKWTLESSCKKRLSGSKK